jgi:hypothetical protein
MDFSRILNSRTAIAVALALVWLALWSGCGNPPPVTFPEQPAPLPNPNALKGGETQTNASAKVAK